MTPKQQAIFAIILFVLAGGLTIWANTILGKARKIAKEANIKCESVKEEIKELDKRNKTQYDIIQNLKAYAPFSNLSPQGFKIEKTTLSFDIYATHLAIDGESTTDILIKRFYFNDDREFAELEAQELLDHLNEK